MSNSKDFIADPVFKKCCKNFIFTPLCYQETEYTCGIACLQSVLARYGMYYRQSSLADVLNSQPILGTDYKSILYFAGLLGLKATMEENLCIDELMNYIDIGITPILIIQAWRLEDDIDYSCDWKNAHYIIVCGYHDNGFYIMDPNVLGNYACLSFSDLMKRWHAVDKDKVRHIQSGLIIHYENCPVKYNPETIKYVR